MDFQPSELFDDFLAFSEHHIESRDVDPLYPVLRKVHDLMGLNVEERIQHCMLYLAYYNLVSAMKAWGEPMTLQLAKLPCGTERRGLRGGIALLYHWNKLTRTVEEAGGWHAWVTHGWTDDPAKNWHIADWTLTEVHGNGRWASYKARELLQKVCLFNIVPQDMGHRGSTSPRKGLRLIIEGLPGGDSAGDIEVLDRASDWLLRRMPWAKDLGEAETSCCDFHSLVDGRYYVGHDIDHLLEIANKLDKANPVEERIKWLLFTARAETLPEAYLGEFHNWSGVDKQRCGAYQRGEGIWIR